MNAFFRPLQPVALYLFVCLCAGIALGDAIPDMSAPFAWAGGACLVLFCTIKPLRFFNCLIFFICLGCLSYQTRMHSPLPDHHISHYLDSEAYTISGTIRSFSRHYSHKSRFVMDCSHIVSKAGIKQPVTGKIYLSIYGDGAHQFGFGDRIELVSTIRSIRNFQNPGAFDYRTFLKRKKIFGTAYTNIKRLKVISSPDPFGDLSSWIRRLEIVRNQFSRHVLQLTDDSTAGKIIVSLVTGKKELIPTDLRDLFSKAGISHLLAISGLHLSIIGLLVFRLVYQLSFLSMARFHRLTASGMCKRVACMTTIFVLFWYTLFSGFSPSTQRAFIMTTVFLLSFVFENETDLISGLCVAGILILLRDSAALFSISFQLSFAAVFCIVSGMQLLKKKEIYFKNKWVSKITGICFVTLFAGLGTAPLTAHYFHMMSLVQFLGNLVAIPLLGFIVLPLGFVSLAGFLILPGITRWLVFLAEHLTLTVVWFANILSSFPFAWFRVTQMEPVQITGIYFALIAFYMWMNTHRLRAAGSIFVSILCFGVTIFSFPSYLGQPQTDRVLKITSLDVGQGSCSVIQTGAIEIDRVKANTIGSGINRFRADQTLLVDGADFQAYHRLTRADI